MIILIIIVVVLLVLWNYGFLDPLISNIFGKPAPCKHCGKMLKPSEQHQRGGNEPFILCYECSKPKIHPIPDLSTQFLQWSYDDYLAYYSWELDKERRKSVFKPDYEYGTLENDILGYCGETAKIRIDSENLLFSIVNKNGKKQVEEIFNFSDISEYTIDYKVNDISDSIITPMAHVTERASLYMRNPFVSYEFSLGNKNYIAKKRGVINPIYDIEVSEEFVKFNCVFQQCMDRMCAQYTDHIPTDGDELQKALTLFMFDSIDGVTEEQLKKQRNKLIKAFHPDNQEADDDYSKKINAAYEVIFRALSK